MDITVAQTLRTTLPSSSQTDLATKTNRGYPMMAALLWWVVLAVLLLNRARCVKMDHSLINLMERFGIPDYTSMHLFDSTHMLWLEMYWQRRCWVQTQSTL